MEQGFANRINGTGTNHFIPKMAVPFDTKKLTNPRIVFVIQPKKSETHRTRLTVAGNLLDYSGTLTNPTATVTMSKCLFNSAVSTPNAKGTMEEI